MQLSVLLPVVLTLIASQPKDNKFLKIVANFCYPRWALEAFVIANAERYALKYLSFKKAFVRILIFISDLK